jgi:dynein heavy chain
LAVEDPNYRYAMINMNYFTDSAVLQRQLEDFIDKRSGKTYGPPSGHLVYFVDDLNLPCGDTYGTQTPISLMRQHMDSGGWFDRTDMSLKKNIINTQYICCMNPKSGTFHVSTRLQRLFVTFGANLPSDGDLNTIFGTILSSHLFSFDSDINNMSKTLTDMTIAVHKEISAKFLPSAIKFYYLFTMRDLASVFKGLLFCRPTEYKQPKMMLRLWYHEMMRVYSDRLINDIEVGRCRELVITAAKRFIEDEKFDECYNDPCIFSHFGKDGSPMSPYMP